MIKDLLIYHVYYSRFYNVNIHTIYKKKLMLSFLMNDF